jgi:hypothetical protein
MIIYTYTICDTSYSATPCFCSPCYSPLTSLCFPLLAWKPSFGVMRPCPPWSQVARKLTSPFSSPPHSLPAPNSRPTLLGFPSNPALAKTTSRSRLPGSGTLSSAATEGGGFFCGLPRCKKADLMTADEAVAGRCRPRSCWRGGRAPNQCEGRQMLFQR